ncbi:hypothetical protein ACPOL_6541 [Acidisarcina polymorpha]|uniref:Uncharacterized protein n=1 Tax=Acidisarcina polymorpha TaxID=2211140 RepID=A0A2Z5G9E1_9BACT|nr:hypothetical protein ACPOL_6541 [Acidisarcina polymorpha]
MTGSSRLARFALKPGATFRRRSFGGEYPTNTLHSVCAVVLEVGGYNELPDWLGKRSKASTEAFREKLG